MERRLYENASLSVKIFFLTIFKILTVDDANEKNASG